MKTIIAIIVYLSLALSYGQQTPESQIIAIPVTLPVDTLYIIDGVPETNDGFKKLNPDDIISITILKNAEIGLSCYNPRDVIVVKTKKSLTKGEKRKLKRNRKKVKAELENKYCN